MTERLPAPIRRGSVLFGVCAVAGLLIAVLTIACWVRIGTLTDAYHQLPWTDRELRGLDRDAGSLRAEIGYNVFLGPVLALAAAGLAISLRRPWRWVRTAALWFAGGAVVALLIGLTTTPVDASDQAAADSPLLDMGDVAVAQAGVGAYPLASWYVYLYVALGLIALGTLITALVTLSRVSVLDFYRPASRVEDPRWSSFVEKRRESQERGD